MQQPDWQSMMVSGVMPYINGDQCNMLAGVVPDGTDALVLCEATVHVPPVSVYEVMQEVCEQLHRVHAEVGVGRWWVRRRIRSWAKAGTMPHYSDAASWCMR